MSAEICELTDHCCRRCLGPILYDGEHFFCAVCSSAGSAVTTICGCGIAVAGKPGKDIGFHCAPNPARGPQNPARIVIAFGPAEIPDGEKPNISVQHVE